MRTNKIFKIILPAIFVLLFLGLSTNSILAQCKPGNPDKNPNCQNCDANCAEQYPNDPVKGKDCCQPYKSCSGCDFCASNPCGSQFQKWQEEVNRQSGNTIDTWTSTAFLPAIFNSFSTALAGDITKNQCISEPGKICQQEPGGAIGFFSNSINAMLSKPPASSVDYVADLGKSFGIVKPVYAQGTGFLGMNNLLSLWKAVRDFTYIIFVVLFLFTGLAIMFRIKIDPKTAISIQSAIPKLIIAMILITLSYAIVGLVLDLTYVLVYLGILIFKVPLEAVKCVNPGCNDVQFNQSWFSSLSYWDAVGLILGKTFLRALPLAVPSVLGVVLSGVALGPLSFLVAAAPVLIFLVVILGMVLKLFFSLVSCYISIIISLITAPLQIMMGVLPGKQGGFNSWFRNLIANALVFPAVSIWFFVAWLIFSQYSPTWVPPAGFGGIGGSSFAVILGIGMLLLAGKIPEMVKSAFKIKDEGYGSAIGKALGPVGTASKLPIQDTSNRIQEAYKLNPSDASLRIGKSISDIGIMSGFIRK